VVVYQYDEVGDLALVRNLATGQTRRYGYDPSDGHLLLAAVAEADGEVILYNSAPVTVPIQMDLGGVGSFMGQVATDSLLPGITHFYTFSLRDTEIASTVTGELFVRIVVETDGTLAPAAPEIIGLSPLATEVDQNLAQSLYVVENQGLYVVGFAGADPSTSGTYEFKVSIAGDINADGLIDGLDSQLLSAAQGTVRGEPGYLADADLDGSGIIDAADTQILIRNFGFIANQSPTISPDLPNFMTHRDLSVVIRLDDIASDPDGDTLYYRITDVANGTAMTSATDESLLFTPDQGYSGPASITVVADDGFNLSDPAVLQIEISDAPLLRFEIRNRLPRIEIGDTYQLEVLGDFADQENVPLIGTYLTYTSSDPAIASVSEIGLIAGWSNGSAAVIAAHGSMQVATAVTVGIPEDSV
jgi:hypothetical protein